MGTKLLWLLTGAIALMILLTLVMPRGKETLSPKTTARPSSVAEGEKVAAIPPPEDEELPPRPSEQPSEWRVLFTSPRNGKQEVSRRIVVKVFFNVPVEQGVVERAFTISPSVPGTFSWPKADRFVFTPNDALLPATQYTVSLSPVSGSHAGRVYTLLGANWSFTTEGARTYRKDINPLVSAYCVTCHGPNGPAARIPLETYSDVSRYVVPGRSGESRFYTFVQERTHHINMAGPNHSTNDKLLMIKDWIDEDQAAE